MAFIPENYLQAEVALDRISADASRFFEQGDQAIANVRAVAKQLADMGLAHPTGWADAAAFIDAQAAAAPADEDWAKLKARKDKLQADFLAMRDTMIAVRDAAETARG